MKRFLSLMAFLWCAALPAAAQELTALARVDPARSNIEEGWFGKTTLTLGLSQGIPFRIFTLDAPPRLVVDFREVDWTGIRESDLLAQPGQITGLRFGTFQPGWSRLVADLSEPMLPEDVAMPIEDGSGRARLEMTLSPVDPERFAEKSGIPGAAGWAKAFTQSIEAAGEDDFVVVIDPGHGGIDPGAERGGLREKDLMLDVARALADRLRRGGIKAVLTRNADVFVALETRVALAHQAGGDLFVSLHADILTQGGAKGATVYLLSDAASDAATEHLAARHNRADILAGADLTGRDDEVTSVLLDLARQETKPRSEALAEELVKAMFEAGGPMNRRPLRRAGFSVLKSADIPSVLIELGFLSSERDLENLRDPVWRAGMVEAIAKGIANWRDADAARRPLVRQ